MTRQQAEDIVVKVLYGAPGEEYQTEDGAELLRELLDQMGLKALADEAVIRLAGLHQQRDEQNTRRLVAR